ncbi:hypothetical protein TSOC_008341 [Tetrabaena socialis]|uniref:RRM domain-containing protein n=1 Tax=Tetrabaena socialis TaxID=47790 RepID=A0A2J7ZYR1_9CHLO|nr:hypothetical protein TSOC_008341 [Tetrabaena socialis]|eukprot:PNH05407.1 hypothetical protein TSOC_008341 [Tetrabaena socialis]
MACAAQWPAQSVEQSVAAPSRALFAKGLAKGCTCHHLHAIFSTFGTVTDCQIARHRSGRSAGFAIVTFLRNEEATAAMQAVDNLMFMGRRLCVKWFSPERALEGVELNMNALQQALQLSHLPPTDLMAQLATMLESPQQMQTQPQSAHVAAWLDNFSKNQDSPLALPGAQQLPMGLLGGLSLAAPHGAIGMPPPSMPPQHRPAAALPPPDGAVFITADRSSSGQHKANAPLAQSRLARWCAAPGSATTQSSVAHSLMDDAGSETASLHASDDSSTMPNSATTTATGTTIANAAAAFARLSYDASGDCGFVDGGAASPVAAAAPTAAEAAEEFRAHALAAAVANSGMTSSRPGIFSDPGSMYSSRRPSGPGYHAAAVCAAPPALAGAPTLPPIRTTTVAAAAGANQRFTPQAFASCGGGGAAPGPALQQAMRLQQALAEQARTINTAQQQYMDALARLSAARDQVAAAATLLGGGAGAGGLQAPPPHMAMVAQQQQHHHHHFAIQQQQQQQQAAMMAQYGGAHAHAAPDYNTLLMLQTAAGFNRPMF